MKKVYLFFILCWLYPALSKAQFDNPNAQFNDNENENRYSGSIEGQGIYTSNGVVPFWMRSDQYGSVPLAGTSGSLIGRFAVKYDSVQNHTVDWGMDFEGRVNEGNTSQFILVQADAKLKLWIFEIKAGRSKDIMGLVDTTLSSGAFAQSGNALGVPMVQIAIPQFYTLPILGDFIAIKGNFAWGWLGQMPIQIGDSPTVGTYYHQLSFYGRLGSPDWGLHLIGGINHQVYWGHDKEIYGSAFKLTSFQDFEYVVIGRTYKGSKIGNHLGSVDLGLTYDWPNTTLFLYRQNFYDEGALYHLANLRDGLNGISLTNHNTDGNSGFQWKKLVFEFFYSANQAGYPWSKHTPSGDENYYNNYEYTDGWSYQGVSLGSPFITPANSTKKGLPDVPTDYFNNNRVLALYTGLQFIDGNWTMTARISYSKNYGTFGTSIYGASLGHSFSKPKYGIFPELDQFSTGVGIDKFVGNGFHVGCMLALDNGKLFYNSVGGGLKVSKNF